MSRCTLDGDPMEVESRCAAAPSHFRVDPVPALDRSNGRAHSQRHATVQTRRAIEASGFDHARQRAVLIANIAAMNREFERALLEK